MKILAFSNCSPVSQLCLATEPDAQRMQRLRSSLGASPASHGVQLALPEPATEPMGHGMQIFVVVIWWWSRSRFTCNTAGAIEWDVATRTGWTLFNSRMILNFARLARDTSFPLWILFTAHVHLRVSVQPLPWWTQAMFTRFPIEWLRTSAIATACCGRCFGSVWGQTFAPCIGIIVTHTSQGRSNHEVFGDLWGPSQRKNAGGFYFWRTIRLKSAVSFQSTLWVLDVQNILMVKHQGCIAFAAPPRRLQVPAGESQPGHFRQRPSARTWKSPQRVQSLPSAPGKHSPGGPNPFPKKRS